MSILDVLDLLECLKGRFAAVLSLLLYETPWELVFLVYFVSGQVGRRWLAKVRVKLELWG